jgi:Ca2+-binding EF-hand superfamily protein
MKHEFYTRIQNERQVMKLKNIVLVTMLAIGSAVQIASAQDNNDGPPGAGGGPGEGGPGGPGGFGHHHHRPPPLPLITALDANHDGVIDSNEIANASAALLTLDKNGDGVLTTNEYLPPMPKDAPADAPRPPLPLIVKALDVNGDGVIDATEIANASAALRALDKNGDGVLTPDEFIGRRPGRPHGGHGPNSGNGNEAGGPPPEDGPGGGPPPVEN